MASDTLRVATWNINSLRLRLGLLKDLVTELGPDVICLQETKVRMSCFPAMARPLWATTMSSTRG